MSSQKGFYGHQLGELAVLSAELGLASEKLDASKKLASEEMICRGILT